VDVVDAGSDAVGEPGGVDVTQQTSCAASAPLEKAQVTAEYLISRHQDVTPLCDYALEWRGERHGVSAHDG
jgi:hypothetical protein